MPRRSAPSSARSLCGSPCCAPGRSFPSFLEPRRHAEQALGAVAQEAYINGVPTRKVDRLIEQLGIASMSRDQVSRLCRGLGEEVRIFRERPREGRHRYLRPDGKIEKARERGGACHKCVVIANAVHESCRRDPCALDAMVELHHLIGRLRDTPDIGPRRAIALSEPACRDASGDRSLHVYAGERGTDHPQTPEEQAAATISKGLANLLDHTCGSAGTVRPCDAGDALSFERCDDGATTPTEPRFGSGLTGLSVRALTIGASPTFAPGEAGGLAVIVPWTAAAA